jgi:hypothetical protein
MVSRGTPVFDPASNRCRSRVWYRASGLSARNVPVHFADRSMFRESRRIRSCHFYALQLLRILRTPIPQTGEEARRNQTGLVRHQRMRLYLFVLNEDVLLPEAVSFVAGGQP